MKRVIRSLLVSVLVLVTPLAAQSAAKLKEERIQASYLLAFGRKATADEVKYWSGQKFKDVSELIKLHKDFLAKDRGTREASIRKSYVDTFGRNPDAAEIKHWAAGVDTYADLMAKHSEWLKGASAEQDAVINRSYQTALGRKPSDAERAYWRQQGVLNYLTLVACHEEWKKSNPQKTSGTAGFSPDCPSLATVSISSALVSEVRAASPATKVTNGQMVSSGGQSLIAAGGQNLIAAGGQNLIAAGGQNLIAAGGQNLIAAGGQN